MYLVAALFMLCGNECDFERIDSGRVVSMTHREVSCKLGTKARYNFDGSITYLPEQQCHPEEFNIEIELCSLNVETDYYKCRKRTLRVDQSVFESCAVGRQFVIGPGCIDSRKGE